MTACHVRAATLGLLLAIVVVALAPATSSAQPVAACEPACEMVDEEHTPWHDACPTASTCHPLVEHHHGPAAVMVLPTRPSLAAPAGRVALSVPLETFPSPEIVAPLERPPRASLR